MWVGRKPQLLLKNLLFIKRALISSNVLYVMVLFVRLFIFVLLKWDERYQNQRNKISHYGTCLEWLKHKGGFNEALEINTSLKSLQPSQVDLNSILPSLSP